MRTRENINKSISGSKDCKFYYDKITKKVFKWFKGDEDIDLNIYAWGRYHISDETKNKLSELSKIISIENNINLTKSGLNHRMRKISEIKKKKKNK